MASQYAFPATDLIGREVEMNVTGDQTGAAYDERRKQGYRTRIMDAGNMTGQGAIWIDCADGTGFRTDQYSDYRVVE